MENEKKKPVDPQRINLPKDTITLEEYWRSRENQGAMEFVKCWPDGFDYTDIPLQ